MAQALKKTFSTERITSRAGKGILGAGAVVMAIGAFPGFDDKTGEFLNLGTALYQYVLVLCGFAAGFWKEGN